MNLCVKITFDLETSIHASMEVFLFQKGGACIMLKKITFLYENDKKSVIYGIILSNVKLYLTKFKAVLGR